MRRAFVRIAACVCLGAGLAATAWARDLDCSDPDRKLKDVLRELSAEFSSPGPAADPASKQRDERLTDALTDELASRATSDGLAIGRLDFLRRAFVALDLGAVSEDENSLVFNFNPGKGTEKSGQFSPRIIVHQAALYGPLDDEIDTLDETIREASRDALDKGLGDLDDVEYVLRYTPHSQLPTADARIKDVQRLATQYYDKTPKEMDFLGWLQQEESSINDALPQESRNPFPGNIPMGDICGNADAKNALQLLVNDLGLKIAAANELLRKRLEVVGFFRLADLIDGEPRFLFNGSTRQRADAAGPDETTLSVTWQIGAVSYRGARRYAEKKLGKAELDVTSVDAYFETHGRLADSLPLFSFVGEYSRVSSFQIAIPGVVDEFRTEPTHKLTAKLAAGCYLGAGHDTRLDLTASYDDVKDDTTLLDRFVAELSWTQQLGASFAKIAGGPEFVATLVYANKPEFRGAVDEDLGLRAGIKWSVGKKKDGATK